MSPLSDYPEDEIIAEAFRIMRERQKQPPRPKTMKPCPKCGRVLGAIERRFKCPEHQPPQKKRASRKVHT